MSAAPNSRSRSSASASTASTVPCDSGARESAVRESRRWTTRSAASVHARASAVSRSCRSSSASSLPLAFAARSSPFAPASNRTRATRPTETVRRPSRPAHSKIARAVCPAPASTASGIPARTAGGRAFRCPHGIAVQRPGEERFRVPFATRVSGYRREQMSPGRLGIQETARHRGISCLGLRVEERTGRPRMALDQTRVDVERLEPLLHKLPRLDGKHPAVGRIARAGRRPTRPAAGRSAPRAAGRRWADRRGARAAPAPSRTA